MSTDGSQPDAAGLSDDVVQDLIDRIGVLEDAVSRGQWDPDMPEDLPAWVAKLVQIYNLYETIPDTWATIPALVAELRALRLAHKVAYHPQAAGGAQLAWHEATDRFITRASAHTARHVQAEGNPDLAASWAEGSAAPAVSRVLMPSATRSAST